MFAQASTVKNYVYKSVVPTYVTIQSTRKFNFANKLEPRRFASVRKILAPTSIQMIKNPIVCPHCKHMACVCLYCHKVVCPQPQALIAHAINCTCMRSYYCPGKNIVFFFNTGAVHFAAGPYLSKNGEDDLLFRKKISMELDDELVNLLEQFIHYGNYYLIDLGRDVVDINKFFYEIMK